MRVTNSMMARNLLASAQRNSAQLARSFDRLGTGKRLTRASEDPVATGRALLLRGELRAREQFTANVQNAAASLSASEAALGRVVGILQRARELAVYGASDSLSGADRAALAQEAEQLVSELVETANTRHAGRFLFSGTQTLTMPFTTDGAVSRITYQGNQGRRLVEVQSGETVTVNSPGDAVFVSGSNLFDALIQFRDALRNDEASRLQSQVLPDLDRALDQAIDTRSGFGATLTRLEREQSRIESERLAAARRLSATEDSDLAADTIELEQTRTQLQAMFAAGSRIIPTSLIDYLA